MKNEQEEMTNEEFKKDPYAGYGLTHLDIVDEVGSRILKLNVLGLMIALLGIGLAVFKGLDSVAMAFTGIYLGIAFISFYLIHAYKKSEYTKFRKVKIVDEKQPTE